VSFRTAKAIQRNPLEEKKKKKKEKGLIVRVNDLRKNDPGFK
jgi:hypothetical protein